MEFSLGSKCALGIYYMIICLGGLIGNVLVILSITCKEAHRKKQANVCLLTLSIADLLTSVVNIPFFMFGLDLPDFEPSQKQTYNLTCRLAIFFVYSCGVQRILSLTVMSVDRYIAILHPFRYQVCTQGSKILVLNCYTVVQSIATSLPLLIIPGWVGYDGMPGSPCGLVWKGKFAFLAAFFLLNFVIPCFILVVTNVRVFMVSRKQRKRLLEEERSRFSLDISTTPNWCRSTTISTVVKARDTINMRDLPGSVLGDAASPNPDKALEILDNPRRISTRKKNSKVPRLSNITKEDVISKATGKLSKKKHSRDRSMETIDDQAKSDIACDKPDTLEPPVNTRRRISQDIKIALSTVMLVVVFVVTWLPFTASRMVFIANREFFSWTVVAITTSLTLVGAVCNPLIVIVTRRELRRTIVDKIWRPCTEICNKNEG